MKRFWKFVIFFLGISVLLLTLKYHNIILILIAPIGFIKTFSGSQITFSEKLLVQMASTFSSHNSIEFLAFACFCCCFDNHKTRCDVLLITNALQTPLCSHWGILECFFVFRWKQLAIEKFFRTLTNLKFFVNCYSFSVLTGTNWFLLQLVINWIAVSSTNYWL